MKYLFYCLIVTFSYAQDTSYPILSSGEIIKVEKTESIQIKNDENTESDKFIIITIKLAKGRSLGIYDYKLISNNITYDCKYIGIDKEEYDKETWQFMTEDIDKEWKDLAKKELSGDESKTLNDKKYKEYFKYKTVEEGTLINLVFPIKEDINQFTISNTYSKETIKPAITIK